MITPLFYAILVPISFECCRLRFLRVFAAVVMLLVLLAFVTIDHRSNYWKISTTKLDCLGKLDKMHFSLIVQNQGMKSKKS